ncbi:MAG: WG repeat-containing protein [Clostridiales bacterium]|nr:WG repeat-containing protein [Clostridiales bacterium]
MKKVFCLILVCILVLSACSALATSKNTISDFSNDLARMKKSGLYGFINKHGEWIVEPLYHNAANYSNGYAWVKTENGQEHFLDSSGNIVSSGRYGILNDSVAEGLAVVSHSEYPHGYNTYQQISPDAVVPTPPEGKLFLNADSFSDGLAFVEIGITPYNQLQDKYFAYIDHQGNIQLRIDEEWCKISSAKRLSPYITDANNFVDGYAVLSGEVYNHAGTQLYGKGKLIINKAGDKLYIHEGNDIITNCGNGIFCIYNETKNTYSYIHADGSPLTQEVYSAWREKGFKYSYDYLPSDGIAAVGIDRKGTIKPCYIDLTTMELLPSDGWEDIAAFSEGMAAVKKDGKWGYINTAGEYVIQPQYDLARPFCCGVAIVDQGDEWFIIDTQGNILY